MSNIQYQYLFGPKSLFEFCEDSSSVFAVSFLTGSKIKISYFPDNTSLANFLCYLPIESLISVAMRKEISPPWISGNQPKVGETIFHEVHDLCEFIGVSLGNKEIWYIRKHGGVIHVDKSCCHKVRNNNH